jgi:lipoate-protein ligase B
LSYNLTGSHEPHAGYFLDLGLIGYEKAWEIQRQLWSRRVQGDLPDLVVFLEHPHVITLGRRGNQSHLLVPQEVLESMGIPLFHVERGGDITYHGPGQLVIYPILNLKDYGYRLVRYVEQLEEVVIRTLMEYGITGRRDPINRGVWVGQEKIASVGVAIKRWVSFHGLSLNYATDLSYFDLMNPCGLEGKKITSMEKILGNGVERGDLVRTTLSHLKGVFARNWEKKELRDLGPDIDRC